MMMITMTTMSFLCAHLVEVPHKIYYFFSPPPPPLLLLQSSSLPLLVGILFKLFVLVPIPIPLCLLLHIVHLFLTIIAVRTASSIVLYTLHIYSSLSTYTIRVRFVLSYLRVSFATVAM